MNKFKLYEVVRLNLRKLNQDNKKQVEVLQWILDSNTNL